MKYFYSSQKETYKDKLVDYPDSPTGKAYVGIAKRPLMKNIVPKYGYQGVLMQDEDRKLVQCSLCGNWLKIITQLHLQKCNDSIHTTNDYKKAFGLYSGKGLVSDETSLSLTKNALKNIESIKNFPKIARSNGKYGRLSRQSSESMQWKNKYGSCPEQLRARLKEFIETNKELPSTGNRGRALYKTLVRRFGSASEGFKQYGLPYRERRGTTLKFTFPDNTMYSYNLNKIYDRNALYEMMMQKCDMFKSLTQTQSAI